MGKWQAKEAQIRISLVQSLFRACCMGNLQPVPIVFGVVCHSCMLKKTWCQYNH